MNGGYIGAVVAVSVASIFAVIVIMEGDIG